ncbi:tRNA preQ1(34) S-adenosylmethionine ribosyltransferase-isomerase QueA [Chelatococcus reniformis]|uniref:S-adenosylmethionine:tRNA ribosyltransferase-isomerase n=1 Tax=Chelatococcus reniformis TaxID=1494448 RepID=A0A916U1T7_9HYPH|nr:tRNA preQ1(34) S-adenosylmethionine ribosyltransferase-isomerase QueA [Chelatococcus reniformis]GGC56281.1 S-adenosylmethionine:tRNA ribosyltransferase-isomerase [Chelatococcus reniformis]
MKVDLFDFDLPEASIALRPVEPREAARLLVVAGSTAFDDRVVSDLPHLLSPGDLLILNDTKVIPARLAGTRERAGQVARFEATLHLRKAPDAWLAFARPAKRLEPGDRVHFGAATASPACHLGTLDATVEGKGEGGEVRLRFDLAGAYLDEALHQVGAMPLPPYIASRRAVDERDQTDYQTVFARQEGAVAAPTAGLHMTAPLLARLADQGIALRFVTLHVGAGTFLPVKAEDTNEHRMHAEWGILPADTAAAINRTRAAGGRIVAVGTTSLRLLESAAASLPDGAELQPWSGETALFITPGYRFRAVDRLMTNFHLPRSTLFMLVSAFSGLTTMHAAYRHAVATGYRFYSYGDACLLSRTDGAT